MMLYIYVSLLRNISYLYNPATGFQRVSAECGATVYVLDPFCAALDRDALVVGMDGPSSEGKSTDPSRCLSSDHITINQ